MQSPVIRDDLFYVCFVFSVLALLRDSQMGISFDEYLDLEGLDCPMPLLKMKQQLKNIDSGMVLYITTTDSGSVRDFAAYIAQTSHILIKQKSDQQRFHFWIKKQA